MFNETNMHHSTILKRWSDIDLLYSDFKENDMYITRDKLICMFKLKDHGAKCVISKMALENKLRAISKHEYVNYPKVSASKLVYVLTDKVLVSIGKKQQEINKEATSPNDKTCCLIAREVVLVIRQAIEISRECSGDLALNPILIYTDDLKCIEERKLNREKMGVKPALSFHKDIIVDMARFTIDDWCKVIRYINEDTSVMFASLSHGGIRCILDILIHDDGTRSVSVACK